MTILDILLQLFEGLMQSFSEMWYGLFSVRLSNFWLFGSLGELLITLVIFVVVLGFIVSWVAGDKGGAE